MANRVLALLLAPALAACSPDAGGGAAAGGLSVVPRKVYVGVDDAGHGFTAPLQASGASGLAWSATSGAFTVSGDDHGAMVAGISAGHGEIQVTSSDGQTVSIPVVIRAYTQASIQSGQAGFAQIGCNRGGCHDPQGPNITPSGIGKFDDLPLDTWITMGQSLDGGQTVQFHQWNETSGLSLSGQMGIVGFLRSQAPNGPPTQQ